MTGDLPGRPVTDTGRGMAPPVSGRPGRRVIAVMLLAAAVLDIARCGVAVASARPAGPTAGLVAAGVAAAALSLRTAHACQRSRRWAVWAALLIGTASGPQAAASGFDSPYTVPDTVTAALGVMLAVTVLATAGRAGAAAQLPEGPCTSGGQWSSGHGQAPH